MEGYTASRQVDRCSVTSPPLSVQLWRSYYSGVPVHSPRSQSCDDAISTEAMQTFFGGHCVLQHVQTDRTHEFTVQGPGGHCYLQAICDGLLWQKQTHRLRLAPRRPAEPQADGDEVVLMITCGVLCSSYRLSSQVLLRGWTPLVWTVWVITEPLKNKGKMDEYGSNP